MTLTGLARALWKALLPHLRAIGRRLLLRLRRMGTAIVGWMRRRVELFERAHRRARNRVIKRWRQGQIRRWTRAADWLDSRLDDGTWIGGKAATLCMNRCPELNREAMRRGIPLVAAAERDPSRRAA